MFFQFKTNTLFPSGSTVLLQLPNEFSLNTSSPVPAVECPMFSGISAAVPLSIILTKTTVTFTNLAPVPPLSTFTLTLLGVKMPNITTLPNSTNNFSLTVTKNNKLVTYINYFDTLYYSSSFSVDSMQIQLYIDTPVTSLSSQYIFKLTPYHSVPIYGTLKIVFPFNLSFMSCSL
jgi:hypothetical protein